MMSTMYMEGGERGIELLTLNIKFPKGLIL